MQQANEVTVTAEESQKIKKLRTIRVNTTSKQTDVSKSGLQRFKSNNQPQQQQMNRTRKLPIKPLSSMGKRPGSARKTTEMSHSAASTAPSAKNEEQVKQLINTVFSHSKKLHNFLSENSLSEEDAYQSLVSNQLFTLSLIKMVSSNSKDCQSQQLTKCVERCCIHKLQRIIAIQKQKNLCEKIENKIQGLIEKRIKQLKSFS